MKKQLLNMALLLATVGTVNAQVSFASAVNYSVGDSPPSVFSADFNADGKMDLATANYGTNNVSILLGSGTGTFAAAINYGLGTNPISIFSADFNGDGNMDLVTANPNASNVSILLGSGTGTFAAAFNYNVGGEPLGVFSADFNGDGNMDLATANKFGDNVSVLLGSGTGTFAAAVNYAVGTDPASIYSADFNGDGKMDLAIANMFSTNVSVLLGSGTGTFAAAVNFNIGTDPFSIFSADFNGDGNMDLVTANYYVNSVSVLLGSGTGTFAAAVNYAVGSSPQNVFSADFDGDGKMDLATTNRNSNNVSVLSGSGTGTFATAVNYNVGLNPQGLFSADFNGDGKMDLATANRVSSNVSVLLNDYLFPAAALNFDGVNDNVTVPYNSAFDFGLNDFTIETWAKTTSTTGNQVMIGRISTNNYWFGVSNGKARFSMTGNDVAGTSTIGDGNWHHIAAVRKGGIQYMYVDGVLEGTQNTTATGTFAGDLTIGNFSGGFNFSGSLDEIRIWNRALCRGEILNNMNGELSMPQTNLAAYYKFNQGIENSNNSAITTLADSSGNGLNGTLTYFTLTGTASNWIYPGAVISGSNVVAFVSPIVSISGVNEICQGASTNLTASGNVTTYNWISGPTTATNSVSPTSLTTYSVVGTNSLGCLSNTAAITITVNALPSLLVSTTNTLLCIGQTATLSVAGANSYTWNTTETTTDIAVSPTTTTVYTVTGTDAIGCENTITIQQDVSLCTGIASLVNDASINVYPNPSTGIFVVAGFETGTKLEVVNVIGEVVYKSVTTDTKTNIDLSDESNGVYFIKTSNGFSYKIIKQN